MKARTICWLLEWRIIPSYNAVSNLSITKRENYSRNLGVHVAASRHGGLDDSPPIHRITAAATKKWWPGLLVARAREARRKRRIIEVRSLILSHGREGADAARKVHALTRAATNQSPAA